MERFFPPPYLNWKYLYAQCSSEEQIWTNSLQPHTLWWIWFIPSKVEVMEDLIGDRDMIFPAGVSCANMRIASAMLNIAGFTGDGHPGNTWYLATTVDHQSLVTVRWQLHPWTYLNGKPVDGIITSTIWERNVVKNMNFSSWV